MEYKDTAESEIDYFDDIKHLFHLFTLPRMEYHSRENKGFWDQLGTTQFLSMYTDTHKKHLLHILNNYFQPTDDTLEIVDKSLGNYMNSTDSFTITLYGPERNRNQPIGVRIVDSYIEQEKTVVVERDRTTEIINEETIENFDQIYGIYNRERTNVYGERSYSFTISYRNTQQNLIISCEGDNYNRGIRKWEESNKKSKWYIPKVVSKFSD